MGSDRHILQAPTLASHGPALLSAGVAQILPEDGLAAKLALGRPLRVKLGIDPTAPDLHLGHTVVLDRLRAFQDAGHEVVLIIGDFTASIGDPTGRSATRPPLSAQQIQTAAASFQAQAELVLDPSRLRVEFNSAWLNLSFAEVLSRLTSAVTVAQLIAREDFAKRLAAGDPLSLTELMYPVCQAQDSVEIKADVEIGGSDQTFNLLLGRELQKSAGQSPQVCLTLPLLVGTDGTKKMSKSLGNHIALQDSATQIFGKAMSLPDAAMPGWFELLFAQPMPELAPREAKRLLARSLAERWAGAGAGLAAQEEFDARFVRHELPAEIPSFELASLPAGPQAPLIHLPHLAKAVFSISATEARRKLAEGGLKLDGQRMDNLGLDVEAELLRGAVLSLGKRRLARLV